MGGFEKEILHCSEKVALPLSSLHYALLFQKPADKAFWLGCFTLAYEIRRATIQQLEAGLTQVKLGWWQSALAASKVHKAQHPVILALGQDRVNALSDEHWARLINATADACEIKPFASWQSWFNDLSTGIDCWIDVVEQFTGPIAVESKRELSIFWTASTQLTQLLRMAKYLDDGFQPIPVSELASRHIEAEQLKSRARSAELAQMFDEVSGKIMANAESSWDNLSPDLRLKIRPLRALFRMRKAELKLHSRQGWPILSEQKELTPWKKFSLSWTTQALRL